MRVIRGIHNLRSEHKGCVATIGNFDGVHRGHQSLLQALKLRAKALSLPVTVIIFEPQPREFFSKEGAPGRITRFRDKVERLFLEGVDQIVCLSFNERLRSLTAEKFVQTLLVDGLDVKHLVVGDDFKFGCDRSGDYDYLLNASKQFGFELASMATFSHQDSRISSTRVREVLDSGDFDLAAELLGWRYQISGKVVHGRKLGRQLGVPTANLQLSNIKSPFSGVFAVTAKHDETVMPAVANLGIKPTVNGVAPSLEVHILDGLESPDLYSKRLSIEFHAKIRDEKKFNGIEELKAAIEQDIETAKTHFNVQ
jgi:riboflavin kinase/FMN adenylyltransferase